MESLRQIGAGFLLGALSVAIVLGGFSLALAEGRSFPASTPSNTPVTVVVTMFSTLPPIIIDTPQVIPLIISVTPQGTAQASSPTPVPSPTVSITPPPTLTNCQPPLNWMPIIIQPYDTLNSLALVYRTTTANLRQANCLLNDQLVAGSLLYVPPQPAITPISCGAPSGWGYYYVLPGDTLYRISLLYRTTVPQLQQANCLYTTNIKAGQTLRVPNVPTSTPWVTLTYTETSTALPSQTIPPTTPSLPPATTEVAPSVTAPATDTDTPPPSDTPPPTVTPPPTEIQAPAATTVTP